MNLFQNGLFRLHSGEESVWKIDCDALTDEDIKTLAMMVCRITGPFDSVEGIPQGGLRLAKALEAFAIKVPKSQWMWPLHLIVDDVLTTGASIEKAAKARKELVGEKEHLRGIVIFDRRLGVMGPLGPSSWVQALFTANTWLHNR